MKFAAIDEAAERLVAALRALPGWGPAQVIAVGEDGRAIAEAVAGRLGATVTAPRVEHLVLPWYARLPFGALTADNHHYVDPVVAADHTLGAREIAQLCRERLPILRGEGWKRQRPIGAAGGALATVVVARALTTGYRAAALAASARSSGNGVVVVAAACAARDALERVAQANRVVALSVSDGPRFDPDECFPALLAASAR